MKKGVAFFDFDGTIIEGDSFIEFIKYSKGSFFLYACLFINLPFILLYYLNLYRNDKLKEKFFSFLYKKNSTTELLEKGIAFSENVLPALCYKSAIDVMQWHRDRDHDIYILTASSDIWLGEWCQKNDLKLICTDFETENQRFTGRIHGKNCHGAEKLNRIKSILSKYNLDDSYAYGDSDADLHFMSQAKYQYKMALTEANVRKKWRGYQSADTPLCVK